MTNYQITDNIKLYNIPYALQQGFEIVWPNGDGRLVKGDHIFLVVCGDKEEGTYLLGEFECEGSRCFSAPTDLPGYSEVWEKATAQKSINLSPNFMKLALLRKAMRVKAVEDDNGDMQLEFPKVTGHRMSIAELSPKYVETYRDFMELENEDEMDQEIAKLAKAIRQLLISNSNGVIQP